MNEAYGEWTRCFHYNVIKAHRTGWRGVWDALVAAILRRDRLSVPMDVSFSIYVKEPKDSVYIWAGQMEYRDET